MPIDQTASAAAIARAQNFVHGFFRAWDARDTDAVAEVMTAEGTWLRAGKVKVGPAGVREAMAERKTGTVTAHVVTNIHVVPSDGALQVGCYVTTHNEPAGEGPTAAMTLPRSIVIYDLVLVEAAGEGLAIKSITTRPLFRRQA